MTATEGPFLYDEGPEPLHTGAAARGPASCSSLIFGATVLVAVLMAVLLPLVKGSAADQSREVVRVFLAALDKGDTETAYQLLCDRSSARPVARTGVAGRYLGAGTGRVVGVRDGQRDGDPAQRVRVEWADGARPTMHRRQRRRPARLRRRLRG